jgi:isopenicillin-N epimerase
MFGLQRDFLLDPSVTFLNHGSFGATPRPVFHSYQRLQRELELQPVEFLGRRFTSLMLIARRSLADFMGTDENNVVYMTNVTEAINVVAHSLDLGPGDEILSTDHEYGALDRTWHFMAKERGYAYINQPIPVPLTTEEKFVEDLWKGVTPRTRIIFLSHITSPTALRFPVEIVVKRAHQAGIMTIVDGAHAPGQISLRLDELGADFYGGNLHKWLCAPKGAGFLYARPEVQHLLKPLVVSWGNEADFPSTSRFIDQHQWTGTRDISAFLSVPTAIEYQQEHNWEVVRQACHGLVREAQEKICKMSGLLPLSDDSRYEQFAAFPLPDAIDPVAVKTRLYDEYHIEVPLIVWKGRNLIRVSVQGYNLRKDVTKLISAIGKLVWK